MDLWVVALVVEANKLALTEGKLGDTDRQPQRSAEIEVGDLIWEIGGDQSGGSASLSFWNLERILLVPLSAEVIL